MTESPLEFIVNITPIAKGRHKFGNGRTYTPPQTALFESSFKALSRKFRPPEAFKEPLDLTLEFHFLKPKTTKRIFHTVRPDLDNLIKAVMDSMNKVFFIDDAQVVKLTSYKFYSEKEFIRVVIKEYVET